MPLPIWSRKLHEVSFKSLQYVLKLSGQWNLIVSKVAAIAERHFCLKDNLHLITANSLQSLNFALTKRIRTFSNHWVYIIQMQVPNNVIMFFAKKLIYLMMETKPASIAIHHPGFVRTCAADTILLKNIR